MRGDPKGSIAAGTVKLLKEKKVTLEKNYTSLLTFSINEVDIELFGEILFRSKGSVNVNPGQAHMTLWITESGNRAIMKDRWELLLPLTSSVTQVIRNKATVRISDRYVQAINMAPGRITDDEIFRIWNEEIEARREPSPPSADALWVVISLNKK